MRALTLAFAFLALALAGNAPFEATIALTGVESEVQFSLKNIISNPISVFLWDTPLFQSPTGLLTFPSFEITPAPTYYGVNYKNALTEDAYQTVNPNETVTTKVNLAKSYLFTTRGNYTARLQGQIRIAILNLNSTTRPSFSLHISYPLPRKRISFAVTNLTNIPEVAKEPDSKLVDTSPFTNCSQAEQDRVTNGDPIVSRLLNRAIAYLTSGVCADRPAYNTWFGTCDATRYARILQDFQNIRNAVDAGYRIYCYGPQCKPTTYAYVFPTNPKPKFQITLCGSYFKAPETECTIDSTAGVIVHELSHYNVVADTNDNGYGAGGDQILAQNNPVLAVTNADNHEYFTESCPSTVADGNVWFQSPAGAAIQRSYLPAVAELGVAQQIRVIVTCTGCATPLGTRVRRVFNGENYAFRPTDLSIGGVLQVKAIGDITLTLTPAPPADVSVYLYADKWPRGYYNFLHAYEIASGNLTYYDYNDVDYYLSVQPTNNDKFSGILRFPPGLGVIQWSGNPQNAASILGFTLAWVKLVNGSPP